MIISLNITDYFLCSASAMKTQQFCHQPVSYIHSHSARVMYTFHCTYLRFPPSRGGNIPVRKGQTRISTKTKMSSFWWNFYHWLDWKLSFWQLPVQPVMKILSKNYNIFVSASTTSYINVQQVLSHRDWDISICNSKRDAQFIAYNMHSISHTICTVYPIQYAKYIPYNMYSISHTMCTVYPIQCVQYIPYNIYSISHTICTVYPIQYVQYTPYNMYSISHTICTVYIVQYVQYIPYNV